MNTATTCSKCNGKGKIERFSHVDGGECFECGGYGVVEPSDKAPRVLRPSPKRIIGAFVVTSESDDGDKCPTLVFDADEIEAARGFCRRYCRPHAVGCVIRVQRGEQVLAIADVNEEGLMIWRESK